MQEERQLLTMIFVWLLRSDTVRHGINKLRKANLQKPKRKGPPLSREAKKRVLELLDNLEKEKGN